jgi:N-acyl-D-amino-acid deacylase
MIHLDPPSHRAVRLSRRRLLLLSAGAATAAGISHLAHVPAAAAQGATPTAIATPDPAAFDQAVGDLISRWHVPGAQVAVAQSGQLVLSRVYGLADVEGGEPVQPASLFRIASVTKPITAVAILRLVDQGRLTLDTRAFPLLQDLLPPAHAQPDPRLDAITIRDLLQHAGGWNSVATYEPQAPPWTSMAAGVLGVPTPPSARDIVRFMRGQPLDFDPGSATAYSNFGYNVLGRVIEQVSDQGYAEFVQAEVLGPAGITAMRLGRTRLADRASDEVRYYTAPGEPPVLPSVFPGEGYAAPAYGSVYLEALDAHGGWIASAEDLVRFASAVDGQRGRALLKPETVQAMLYTPQPPPAAGGGSGAGNAQSTTGLCWVVTPEAGGVSWSHAGVLGNFCAAWLGRGPDGLALAVVTNSVPPSSDISTFFGELIGTLHAAARQAIGLPAPTYPTPTQVPSGGRASE